MTRYALALLLLLPALALAQPTVTRGGGLKKRQYQTYGNMTLYVDPTGRDSGACTGTGTSACATVQGALDKLPRFLRHNVVINIAAGTYASAINLSGFTFVPTGSTFATLTLQGSTWSNITPATGTATGTLTGVVASTTTPMTFSVVTDSTQTWTPGELKGSYLTATSGANSGASRVIVDNTATTISLNTTTTSIFAVGTTYAIQRPAATLGALTVSGNTLTFGPANTASLIVTDLAFNSAMIVDSNTGPTHGMLLRRAYLIGNLSVRRGAGLILSSGTNYIQGNVNIGVGVNGAGYVQDNGSYIKGNVANAGSYVITSTTNTAITTIETPTTTGIITATSGQNGYGTQLVGTFYPSTTRLWIICTGAGQAAIDARSLMQPVALGDLNITGCSTGLLLSNGSRVLGPVSNWTFSGVTNELSLDGTAYTVAFFNALSPKSIITSLGTSLVGY